MAKGKNLWWNRICARIAPARQGLRMRRLSFLIDGISCVVPVLALACAIAGSAAAPRAEASGPRTDTLYETNYQTGTVQAYSSRGRNLGVVAPISFATGLAFDKTGNLYVSSDDPADYS